MEKRFNDFIKKEKLLQGGGTSLLAISGGLDSVVLFHLLLHQKIDFHCAHVNYTLRGVDSEEDERFVRALCAEHKIRLNVWTIDTKEYCSQRKMSIQEGARKIRYDYFHELVTSANYSEILTAHHADDSVETFFINLIRGTGIKGLAGIKTKNGLIERPLLFASKQNLEDYANHKKLAYRQDLSNLENKYLRNKTRNQFIPLFEQSNPEFKKSMYDNIEHINQALNFLSFNESEFRNKYVESKSGHTIITKKILETKEFSFPVHSILSEYGFTSSQIKNLFNDPSQGATFSSSTHKLFVDRDHLAIRKVKLSANVLEIYSIKNIKDFANLPIQIIASIRNRNDIIIDPNPRIAYFDKDKLNDHIIMRKWGEGDRIRPLGMRGKKSIADYLQQKKIPTYEKEDQWLLTSNEEVAWVCGHGISEDFKISNSTTKVLILEI